MHEQTNHREKTLRGLFLLGADELELIYGPIERAQIGKLVDLYAPPQTPESVARNPEILAQAEVLLSGWGMCRVSASFLNAAPKLKAIFYGAGGTSHIATPEAIARGIVVTSAIHANSIPVAEYTLATILFSLKHAWTLARQTRQQRLFPDRNRVPGCYDSTVGLISLGNTARILLRLLKPFDLNVIAYDPFVSRVQAAELGVELVELDELFRRSDVVSLHAPLNPGTRKMITGEHLRLMKPAATFINTARGEIVCEDQMIEVAKQRCDLQFVLDVTGPLEPPLKDCPLYELPNVVLTPHIAGSAGGECRRLGRYMVEELQRYVSGEPLKWAIRPESSESADKANTPEVTVKVARRPVSEPCPLAQGCADRRFGNTSVYEEHQCGGKIRDSVSHWLSY